MNLSPSGTAGARAAALTLLVLVIATCERQGPTSTVDRRAVGENAVRPSAAVAMPGSTDPQVFVGAGDIGICGSANDQKTATVIDGVVASAPDATVFTLGDNAYPNGSATDFTDCYVAAWGRHQGRTLPAAGERDYNTAGASGYFGFFGEAAGDSTKGYYSYDVGASWHVVVLNSKLPTTAGSAQEQWLKSDLALSNRPCTVAIWHTPRFSSSSATVSSPLKPLWDALYLAGAELILNAHYRNYERFAPQHPDGSADPDLGIRQFVVGTDGAGGTSAFGTIRANSEARSVGTLGVLKLVLDAGSYSWDFLPIAGATYTDSGTGACHGSPPPIANAGGPYQADGAITFDGSASTDPQGDTPFTYAWDFGDGNTGTGATPTHSYAADGEYTVSLVVTDAKGNRSAPTTTTASAANVPPSVSASDVVTRSGHTATLSVSVSDPAPDDAPWSYTVDWGDGTAPSEGSIAALGTPAPVTHVYATAGQYAGLVTVTDKDGGVGTDAFEAAVTDPDPTPGRVFVGAGDVGICNNSGDQETGKLLDAVVAGDTSAIVFGVGDMANPNATAAELESCFGPSWGRHKPRIEIAMGDNEYNIDPNPTWDYFGDRAGERALGYRSFDLGEWHIIYLNDNAAHVPFAAGSQQDLWLQADLAANTKRCTIAIFHQPYSYSNTTTTTIRKNWKIIWQRLYAAGAEIVLNGHVHRYERFAPQTPDRVRDDERGIRQFIVGTGGDVLVGTPTVIAPNSETRSSTRGVLKLTLKADSYEWEFIPVAGKTFTDSGFGTCHD